MEPGDRTFEKEKETKREESKENGDIRNHQKKLLQGRKGTGRKEGSNKRYQLLFHLDRSVGNLLLRL